MEIRKLTLAATLVLSGALLLGCGEDEADRNDNAGNDDTSSEMTTGSVEPANPAEEEAPVVPEDEVGTAADVSADSDEVTDDPVEPTPENTTSGQDDPADDTGEEEGSANSN